MVNLPFHKQREGKTQTSTNFTTSECIREGACGCWGERVGKGVRKGVHGGVPELDGSLIAAGCAGVLRFVRIAGRQQGVKESAVTVTCSSGWCWGAWESCSSCTGHSSSGSQGDLLPPPCKVLPNWSLIFVLRTFQLLPRLGAWVPSKAAKDNQDISRGVSRCNSFCQELSRT